MNNDLLQIPEPEDYFKGLGTQRLPTPTQVLFFLRTSKETLQQKALQNRSHHRTLLCYNLETEGHVHLDHLEVLLQPGQALLILPYQFHHYSQLKSSTLKWLFCSFELEPQGLIEPLRNRVVDPGEKAINTFQQIMKEWQSPSSELQAERVQISLLHLLLCLRQDLQQDVTDPLPKAENSLLRTINRSLKEGRGRTLTVSDLAQTTGYSESRLRFLFRQTAGIPLGRYIQNYRLNRAMSLLRTTSLSIADVAEDAGFGSPQACSRLFKQATGVTPRDYRSGKPSET